MTLPFKFLLPLCLLLIPSSVLFAQWNAYKLPCRPAIEDLQTHKGHAYATSYDGNIYESTDRGKTWLKQYHSGPGRHGLVINPNNWNLYALQNDYNQQQVQISVHFNNGAGGSSSFQAPFASPSYYSRLNIWNDTLYLSNGQNLQYNTFQSGWMPVPVPADFYFHESIVRGKHIWADNYAYVIHSPDGGTSWDTVAYDPRNSIGLATAGDTILVNYFDSVQQMQVFRRTIDRGITWKSANNTFNINQLKSGQPFIGTAVDGAYFSWNGLTDWQKIASEFQASSIRFLGGTMLLGQLGGVETVENGQRRWGDFGTGITNEMSGAPVFLRTADNWLLFGGQYGQGLYKRRSTAGADWTQNAEPYFAERTLKIGNQLLGCGAKGTYRAQLSGPDFKWTLLNTQTGYLFDVNGKPYLVAPDKNIFRSDNGGQTWTPTGSAPDGAFDGALAIVGSRIFYKKNFEIYVSEDEGQTWVLRNTVPQSGPQPGRMYSVGNALFVSDVTQKIYKSTDNGLTFNALSGVPQNPQGGFFRLRMYGDQLFLFIRDGKLYRSADGGQSWLTVKPPYLGFDFDPSVAFNAMTVDGSKITLFDPAEGSAWAAEIGQTAPSPCDSIFVDLSEESCYGVYVDLVAPSGFQHTWLRDGSVIFQGNNYIRPYPDGSGQNGSTYTLIVSDPVSGCSVSDETTIKRPVADVGYTPLLPCNKEFATLDLSKCSHYSGIRYSLFQVFPPYQTVYTNEFDGAGNPSNPSPPAVPPGVYLFQVFDAKIGCYSLDTLHIQRDPNQIFSDYGLSGTTCGQNDGAITIYNDNDPGITYVWNNGATTKSISGLAPGWYSVAVTNGFCHVQYNFEVKEDPICKVRIQGTIWKNTSCSTAWPAQAVPNVMLHLLPDDVYTFSDNQGNYEFTRAPGSGTVEFVGPVRFDLLCPASGSFSFNLPNFGTASNGNDFFVKAKSGQNIGVSASAGAVVSGTGHTIDYSVCNYGDADISGVSLVFKHDAALGNISLLPGFQSYDPSKYTSVSDNIYLPVGYCGTYKIGLQIPPSLPIGTVLHFSMDILPVAGDFFPADNHIDWARTVAASFDPNDKQVSPGETEQGGRIYEKDSLLRYTIRFQNTGNHPATTVEIRDTLDENLDVTSIQSGGTSHPYYLQMRFEGRNVVIFTFNGIHLPDSMASQAMSQGYVSFSIKRKPNLPFGTRIKNRAGIYFDFNAPVITNWVESVISPPVGTTNVFSRFDIRLFPNPNLGQFTVELPAPASAKMLLKISDLAGRVLLEKPIAAGSLLHPIEADALPQGLYFLQVLAGGRVLAVKKFVKQ